MQKVNKPEVVCEDPEDTVVPESCSKHVSPGRGGGGMWGARGGQGA